MYDYIFFDLDGTLTDSQEGILKSLKLGLEEVGIKKNEDELKIFIGPPLYDIFKNSFSLSEEETQKAIKGFRKYFESKGIFENRLYDGIEGVLKKLKSSGKHLVIATSKPEDFAIKIAVHFKIDEYFDFICGSSMDETRSAKDEVINYAMKKCGFTKESPPGENEILMVGDRYNDVQGAHKNGIKALYVLYGYGNQDEAEKCKADFILKTVEDLSNFF